MSSRFFILSVYALLLFAYTSYAIAQTPSQEDSLIAKNKNRFQDQILSFENDIRLAKDLVYATRARKMSLVKELLEQGVNPNLYHDYGSDKEGKKRCNALTFASGNSNIEMIRLLIKHGIDINATDQDGNKIALHTIYWRTKPQVVQLLLDNGLDNISPTDIINISKAIMYNKHKDQEQKTTVKLRQYIKQYAMNKVFAQDRIYDHPALLTAVAFGTVSEVESLLKIGVDINTPIRFQDNKGALAITRIYDDVKKFKFLLNNGIDITRKNGCTTLNYFLIKAIDLSKFQIAIATLENGNIDLINCMRDGLYYNHTFRRSMKRIQSHNTPNSAEHKLLPLIKKKIIDDIESAIKKTVNLDGDASSKGMLTDRIRQTITVLHNMGDTAIASKLSNNLCKATNDRLACN